MCCQSAGPRLLRSPYEMPCAHPLIGVSLSRTRDSLWRTYCCSLSYLICQFLWVWKRREVCDQDCQYRSGLRVFVINLSSSYIPGRWWCLWVGLACRELLRAGLRWWHRVGRGGLEFHRLGGCLSTRRAWLVRLRWSFEGWRSLYHLSSCSSF